MKTLPAIATMLSIWNLAAQAADVPPLRQQIVAQANGGFLTFSITTNTRTPADLPDLRTFIGLQPKELQGLLSGRIKKCVWDFPETKSADTRDAFNMKHWCQ